MLSRMCYRIAAVLIFALLQAASSQTITVTGAGTATCNGIYYKNGSFNGRPYYEKPGLAGSIRYWDDSIGWVIAPSGGTSIY